MMACNPSDIVAIEPDIQGLNALEVRLAKLRVLGRILNLYNPAADLTRGALLQYAAENRITGLNPQQRGMLKMALLCRIAQAL